MGRLAHSQRIGSLDRRIELQTYTATRAATGEEILTWSCVAHVWASKIYPNTKSDEGIEGDQLVSTTRVQYTIRHRCGIEPKMRISDNGAYYNILTVRDDQKSRDRFLILDCELVV